MRSVFLMITSLIGSGLVLGPEPAAAQIVTVTNIEIRMVKTSTRPPLRVTADTRNPNDFAVRDVEVDCTIKDKAGKDLATYTSIIYGTFQPNQRSTTRNLNIGAWPEQGYAALCVSKRGQRDVTSASPAGIASLAPLLRQQPPNNDGARRIARARLLRQFVLAAEACRRSRQRGAESRAGCRAHIRSSAANRRRDPCARRSRVPRRRSAPSPNLQVPGHSSSSCT